jgi:hypothetical protein
MEFDVWIPIRIDPLACLTHDQLCTTRSSLENPAIIHRARAADDPIRIRLLHYSPQAISFISALPLEIGETLDFSLHPDATDRSAYRVANCEILSEDTYRIAAYA